MRMSNTQEIAAIGSVSPIADCLFHLIAVVERIEMRVEDIEKKLGGNLLDVGEDARMLRHLRERVANLARRL
jgi:phosphoribosyl-ATP pyrophosphohydrolase